MPRPLPPLTLRTRAELYTQLAALETAGLPPDKAFGLLRVRAEAQPRLVLARKLLAAGQDPALAGEKSRLFGKVEVVLIRAALAAGSPARVYRRLGELYTARAAQLASFKSRLLLPGFVLLAGLFIAPLPALVTGNIGVGVYLWRALRPVLVIGIVVQLGRFLLRRLEDSDTGLWVDMLTPRLPLIGPVILRRNARDFFETLALLLEAGIPMLDALPRAEEAVRNSAIRRQYEQVLTAMSAGSTLAQALPLVGALGNEQVLAFVTTGEAAGTLPEMLFRHVDVETAAINGFYAQAAVWGPRVLYGLLLAWTAPGIIGGKGIVTQLPPGI